MNTTLDTDTELAADETPLVRRLVQQAGAQWLTPANQDLFIAQGGEQVLFFSGDPVRFPEGQDVAVVLPELQKAFDGRFQVGVVCRGGEDELARRWGAQRWPSLVFVRDGRYLATVAGMQDWTDYLALVAQALAQTPSRPPIALHAAGAASSCH